MKTIFALVEGHSTHNTKEEALKKFDEIAKGNHPHWYIIEVKDNVEHCQEELTKRYNNIHNIV